MNENFFDLFSLYFFMFASLICFVLSLITSRKFKKTSQHVSWIMITLSFALDFFANCAMIYEFYIYQNFDLIPYPSFLDVFWLLSYLFFGLGTMMYWYIIKRKINPIQAQLNSKHIIFGSIAALILSFPILNLFGPIENIIFDPLYFALPFFASITCIPLYYLFKGGKLASTWVSFAWGGFCYMIGELIFIANIISYNYLISDIVFSLAYVFFIKAFYDILYNQIK